MNALLIPVVVRDSEGHAVGGLRKEDFQVLDRGKPRQISGFSVETRASQQLTSHAVAQGFIAPPIPATPPSPPIVASAQRFIVLLFDDLHLSVPDLAQAQNAAVRMVSISLSDSDFAAVVSFSGVSSGLTSDKSKLRDAISKLRVHELYRHSSQSCPDIDYYVADLIVNKRDQAAFDSAVEETLSCAHLTPNMRSVAEGMVSTASGQALSLGDQDMRATLSTVRQVVAKMAGLPGQCLLVLISPGFLTVTMEAMAAKSQILDLAARANVTVSALDARGLYVGGRDVSDPPNATTHAQISGQAARRQLDRGEYSDVLAELADGTGGTFIHNTNDLDGGLRRLTAAPEYVYFLEISLQDVRHDNTFHSLKVKIGRPRMQVQARGGYMAPAADGGKR